MKTLYRGLRSIVALSLIVVSVSALAQFTSSVEGDVHDPTGAAIPEATVKLTNTETQVSTSAVTNDAGIYHFPSLAPGKYLITAQAKGFSQAKVSFVLESAQVRDVSIALSVAKVSTNVVVTTQAPLLDTADSRNQLTIPSKQMQTFPLENRNPTTILGLSPGVSGFGANGYNNFFTENADYSANGRGPNGNQYILDGLNLNIDVNPGVLTLVPNADAVSEIDVQTNTYTVDFGKASSMQTVITTKSGTDHYHGFGSVYYTYQGLDAKGYFFPANVKLEPFHTTNMSFGIGGPILRKRKFFFFFSFEPYRALTENGNSVISFDDPAFASFAKQATPNSPELSLLTKYPASGATTTGVAATAAQAFGPQNLGNDSGCGTPSTDNIPCSTPVFDDGIFNSSSFTNAKQYNFRLDKYFRKDRLYATLFRDTTTGGGPAVRPAFAAGLVSSIIAVQGNETHTFSAHMLNQAFFGSNYLQETYAPTGQFSVPVVNVGGLGVGYGVGFADSKFSENNYHWRDMLTAIIGPHSIDIGVSGWHGNDLALFAPAYAQPNFFFNNMIDLINNNPYNETSLSYNPVTGKPMPGQYEYASTTWGAFAEDTWRVNSHLTINYGIRWDNYGNPYAVPGTGTVVANWHLGQGATFAEQVTNGYNKVQSRVYNPGDMRWIFSPRAGFAWDPTGKGKWVIRGGAGIYRDWVTLGNSENNLKGNPPEFVLPTFFNNGSTAAPIFGFGNSNTYPFGFPYPAFKGSPLDSKGGIPGQQIAVGGMAGNLKAPYTGTWSIAVAREMGGNLVASAAYVGQHSGNLLYGGGGAFYNSFGGDVNLYAGDLLQHLTCTPVSPANGQQATCVGTQTRLNQSFGSIYYTFNGPWSNYEAVILALKGNFTSRGFFTASYTRSASKDNSENYPIEYPLASFYGPSPWDEPNVFSVGWNYNLPALHGDRGLWGRIASGWGLSSIMSFQSGQPFTVFTGAPLDVARNTNGNIVFLPDSGDFNADGSNYDFPDVSSYHTANSRSAYEKGVFPQCSGTNLDNCGPFSFPQLGQEGNERINQFRNPAYANVNGSLFKDTKVAGDVRLEMRIDFFNLLNRVNLNGVDPNAQDVATFGKSTSTHQPRQGQLGLNLSF